MVYWELIIAPVVPVEWDTAFAAGLALIVVALPSSALPFVELLTAPVWVVDFA